jgi:peroxiredoxin Q/BCP
MLNGKAPDFNLESTVGEPIKLSDQLGSFVVLVFYPANETPGCTKQLREMNESLEEFVSHGVQILGINTAPVAKTQQFCIAQNFQFPILSDRGCKVAREYGAYIRWLPMVIRRTVVAVDPYGVICFYQHGMPEPAIVLNAIRQWAIDKGYAKPSNA